VTIRCGATPPSTRSTSVATVLSPQRSRCLPSSHRSPVRDTGLLRCLRRVVGIGQPLRAVREQIAQLQLAKPGQRQVEAAELQLAELQAEEFAIPTRVYASWLSVSR
jgi:hypothetical protein